MHFITLLNCYERLHAKLWMFTCMYTDTHQHVTNWQVETVMLMMHYMCILRNINECWFALPTCLDFNAMIMLPHIHEPSKQSNQMISWEMNELSNRLSFFKHFGKCADNIFGRGLYKNTLIIIIVLIMITFNYPIKAISETIPNQIPCTHVYMPTLKKVTCR